MSWLAVYRIVINAKLRPAKFQLFADSCGSAAAAERPGEDEDVRAHERRHWPRAAKNEQECDRDVRYGHCSNEAETRYGRQWRVWPKHRFEVNPLVALEHAGKVTASMFARNILPNAGQR